MLRTRRVGGRTSFLSAQGYPLIAAWLVDYARVDRVLRQSYNLVNRILVIEREFYKRQETRTDVPANLWARLIVEGQFSWKPWTIKSTAYVVQLAPHTTGYELPGLGVLVDCSRLSLPLPSIGKMGTHFRCYLSSLVSCQNSSSGLGGEVKGRRSGKQDCRQGKAVEIPVWVCLTAPTGGVASGFLRHWTGPASSTREFQGFNINLKTISSDMVHGLSRSLHGYEQLKLRVSSHFFFFSWSWSSQDFTSWH